MVKVMSLKSLRAGGLSEPEAKVKSYSGFTLVEMLVVLAIIVVILSMSAFGIGSSMESARDSRKKNDLRQYHDLLKEYAGRHQGFYPQRTAVVAASDLNNETNDSLCNDLGLDAADTTTDCPGDPRDGSTKTVGAYTYTLRYTYITTGGTCTGGSACASAYVLRAVLESSDVSWSIDQDGIVRESILGIAGD